MAITSGDIKFKLSTKSGSAGNQNTSTPAASLGKYISTTEITSAQLNNLFDDVTGDENANEDVEYRCFFVHNAHASLTLENIKVWMSDEAAGGANIAFARTKQNFPLIAVPVGSSSAQAEEVADESTIPSTLVSGDFYSPTTKETGAGIPDLEPGYVCSFWVRRTAQNNSALDNDGVTLKVEGDTPA